MADSVSAKSDELVKAGEGEDLIDMLPWRRRRPTGATSALTADAGAGWGEASTLTTVSGTRRALPCGVAVATVGAAAFDSCPAFGVLAI
ncbi:MAG: hypothetical protein IJK84_08215 [Bacteroidales bacterium]|nr:hypothetical protein [Bacteroidales bacterium]